MLYLLRCQLNENVVGQQCAPARRVCYLRKTYVGWQRREESRGKRRKSGL